MSRNANRRKLEESYERNLLRDWSEDPDAFDLDWEIHFGNRKDELGIWKEMDEEK